MCVCKNTMNIDRQVEKRVETYSVVLKNIKVIKVDKFFVVIIVR